MARRFASFALGAAIWAAASACPADGVVLNGSSPRTLSRGGTNLGHFDNGAVLYDNPAAMVNIDGHGVAEIGAIGLLTDFRYSDPQNNNAKSTEFTPLPSLSLIRRSCDGNFAFGVGAFAPAGFGENYRQQGPFPLVGTRTYKSFAALLKIVPGAAVKLTDNLSIGGTFGLGVSYANLEGPYFLNGPTPLAGTPTYIDLHGTGATYVWSAGLQYRVSDATSIGATYIAESDFRLRGNTHVEVPQMGDVNYDSTFDVRWPRSVGVGVRHAICPHRVISTDVYWYDWSNSFDEFAVNLRNPTRAGFPGIVETIPLRWRDSVSVRLGYEHEFAPDRTLRLGYVHHRNPIPAETLTPLIQATMEHAVSAGYGWKAFGWEIDAGYMYVFGPAKSVGASALAGGDFSQSRHDAHVHAMLLGFIRKY